MLSQRPSSMPPSNKQEQQTAKAPTAVMYQPISVTKASTTITNAQTEKKKVHGWVHQIPLSEPTSKDLPKKTSTSSLPSWEISEPSALRPLGGRSTAYRGILTEASDTSKAGLSSRTLPHQQPHFSVELFDMPSVRSQAEQYSIWPETAQEAMARDRQTRSSQNTKLKMKLSKPKARQVLVQRVRSSSVQLILKFTIRRDFLRYLKNRDESKALISQNDDEAKSLLLRFTSDKHVSTAFSHFSQLPTSVSSGQDASSLGLTIGNGTAPQGRSANAVPYGKVIYAPPVVPSQAPGFGDLISDEQHGLPLPSKLLPSNASREGEPVAVAAAQTSNGPTQVLTTPQEARNNPSLQSHPASSPEFQRIINKTSRQALSALGFQAPPLPSPSPSLQQTPMVKAGSSKRILSTESSASSVATSGSGASTVDSILSHITVAVPANTYATEPTENLTFWRSLTPSTSTPASVSTKAAESMGYELSNSSNIRNEVINDLFPEVRDNEAEMNARNSPRKREPAWMKQTSNSSPTKLPSYTIMRHIGFLKSEIISVTKKPDGTAVFKLISSQPFAHADAKNIEESHKMYPKDHEALSSIIGDRALTNEIVMKPPTRRPGIAVGASEAQRPQQAPSPDQPSVSELASKFVATLRKAKAPSAKAERMRLHGQVHREMEEGGMFKEPTIMKQYQLVRETKGRNVEYIQVTQYSDGQSSWRLAGSSRVLSNTLALIKESQQKYPKDHDFLRQMTKGDPFTRELEDDLEDGRKVFSKGLQVKAEIERRAAEAKDQTNGQKQTTKANPQKSVPSDAITYDLYHEISGNRIEQIRVTKNADGSKTTRIMTRYSKTAKDAEKVAESTRLHPQEHNALARGASASSLARGRNSTRTLRPGEVQMKERPSVPQDAQIRLPPSTPPRPSKRARSEVTVESPSNARNDHQDVSSDEIPLSVRSKQKKAAQKLQAASKIPADVDDSDSSDEMPLSAVQRRQYARRSVDASQRHRCVVSSSTNERPRTATPTKAVSTYVNDPMNVDTRGSPVKKNATPVHSGFDQLMGDVAHYASSNKVSTPKPTKRNETSNSSESDSPAFSQVTNLTEDEKKTTKTIHAIMPHRTMTDIVDAHEACGGNIHDATIKLISDLKVPGSGSPSKSAVPASRTSKASSATPTPSMTTSASGKSGKAFSATPTASTTFSLPSRTSIQEAEHAQTELRTENRTRGSLAKVNDFIGSSPEKRAAKKPGEPTAYVNRKDLLKVSPGDFTYPIALQNRHEPRSWLEIQDAQDFQNEINDERVREEQRASSPAKKLYPSGFSAPVLPAYQPLFAQLTGPGILKSRIEQAEQKLMDELLFIEAFAKHTKSTPTMELEAKEIEYTIKQWREDLRKGRTRFEKVCEKQGRFGQEIVEDAEKEFVLGEDYRGGGGQRNSIPRNAGFGTVSGAAVRASHERQLARMMQDFRGVIEKEGVAKMTPAASEGRPSVEPIKRMTPRASMTPARSTPGLQTENAAPIAMMAMPMMGQNRGSIVSDVVMSEPGSPARKKIKRAKVVIDLPFSESD